MQDFEFSEDFCRFIQTAIPAVAAAELLLLLRSGPDEALAPEEAMSKLGPGVSLDEMLKYLSLLETHRLVIRDGGRYRYDAESPLGVQANNLSIAYSQRPVTLIRIIYALRDSNIKSFADAFKLRK